MQTTSPRLVYGSNSDSGNAGWSRSRLRQPLATVCLLWQCILVDPASGTDVRILVKDQTGRPIEGAIVWAELSRGKNPPPAVQTEIVQKNRQFLPLVTVIPVGSVVRFPNWDNVQHQVYSFSAAKTFDIPLYIGESPRAIEFERPGVVTLGCNIHDWMTGYILVLDTAMYAKTDSQGIALLRNVPAEPATIYGWCPRLRGEPVKFDVQPGQNSAELAMRLGPDFRRTPPDDRGGGYR
jgi:plastocyanin